MRKRKKTEKEAYRQPAGAHDDASEAGPAGGENASLPGTANAGPGPESASPLEAETEADVAMAVAAANDRLLRTKAEFENYRKRTQREFGEIREHVKLITIQEFLPVLDHFQMAMAHVDSDTDVSSLKQGMDMIHAEFRRTLEALGVQPIGTVGQPFDPTQHEALAQEPSSEIAEGHIVREWKSGFRLGDRLVRAASVVVSSGDPEETTDGGDA